MPRPDLPQRFQDALREDCNVRPDARLLVGVSGGLDSMALLYLMHGAGLDVSVMHVNYGLRGEASDGDEKLVSETCDTLGLECSVIRLDAGWREQAMAENLQARARAIRYEAFERRAAEVGAGAIAVAHNRDDQVETVLLRMIRGSGPIGLSGMQPTRPISRGSSIRLVRPLLDESRREIKDWAGRVGVPFRDDSSNSDDSFDRARMRKYVVPALVESFGESSLRNIARTAEQTRTALDSVVSKRIESDLSRLVLPVGDHSTSVDVRLLDELDPGWRRFVILEICRRWMPDVPRRASTIDRLEALLAAQAGSSARLGSRVVWRGRDRLVFTSAEEVPEGVDPGGGGVHEERLVIPGDAVRCLGGTLRLDGPTKPGIRRYDLESDGLPGMKEIVDAAILARPVTVGRWRPGDRFRPLGMKGEKKVAEFLTDRKVPVEMKGRQLVVRSGGKIVWVVGHRIDSAFRVTQQTREVVSMEFSPD